MPTVKASAPALKTVAKKMSTSGAATQSAAAKAKASVAKAPINKRDPQAASIKARATAATSRISTTSTRVVAGSKEVNKRADVVGALAAQQGKLSSPNWAAPVKRAAPKVATPLPASKVVVAAGPIPKKSAARPPAKPKQPGNRPAAAPTAPQKRVVENRSNTTPTKASPKPTVKPTTSQVIAGKVDAVTGSRVAENITTAGNTVSIPTDLYKKLRDADALAAVKQASLADAKTSVRNATVALSNAQEIARVSPPSAANLEAVNQAHRNLRDAKLKQAEAAAAASKTPLFVKARDLAVQIPSKVSPSIKSMIDSTSATLKVLPTAAHTALSEVEQTLAPAVSKLSSGGRVAAGWIGTAVNSPAFGVVSKGLGVVEGISLGTKIVKEGTRGTGLSIAEAGFAGAVKVAAASNVYGLGADGTAMVVDGVLWATGAKVRVGSPTTALANVSRVIPVLGVDIWKGNTKGTHQLADELDKPDENGNTVLTNKLASGVVRTVAYTADAVGATIRTTGRVLTATGDYAASVARLADKEAKSNATIRAIRDKSPTLASAAEQVYRIGAVPVILAKDLGSAIANSSVGRVMTTTVKSAWTATTTKLNEAKNYIKTTGSAALRKATGFVASLPSAAKATGKAIVENLKPYARPVKQFVVTVMKNGKPIANAVAKKVDTHFVKPVMNNLVKPVARAANNYVVKPFVNNVAKPVARAANNYVVKPFVNNVAKPLYNAARTGLQTLGNGAKRTGTALYNGAKKLGSTISNSAAGLYNWVFGN